ncbi:hypothetical protein ASPZODRAFT_129174 [Penicilliopsis zonata CBS 506.65]|uniref:HTH araC/xylS-type domain-containing protein n=1 Tax=Penicilliopsis zonata CBS 506.65 TaxID=1073090 RepID=A0A1L9SP19_9EURO|nr:hypothetical protein ASPZODRAFT_129174 [Penicilliopsis zonata CBS 506.65]OJJ48851.1 hypothetical protein ASPZODRAFT_129174 [Penicilliopsis zonata CBS 506.65]
MAQTQPIPAEKIPRLPTAGSTSSSGARWRAVASRDPTATDFVYAVITTRIYCRSSCPARLARRANIVFFDTPGQAEAAGFRACKRCKPQLGSAVSNPQAELVRAACERIRLAPAHDLKAPTLQELARGAGLTPSHFHRVFKKITGLTPGQYAAGSAGKEQWPSLTGGGSSGSLNAAGGPLSGISGSVVGLLDGVSSPIIDLDGPDAILLNEFDILLAAEREFISTQDMHSLNGGLEFIEI